MNNVEEENESVYNRSRIVDQISDEEGSEENEDEEDEDDSNEERKSFNKSDLFNKR